MSFNFKVDDGVRVDETLYREMLKPARAEHLHGDVAHIQCHAEGRFTVTMADGTVKKIRGDGSGRTKVWNLVAKDRAAEPDRLYSWLSERHGGVRHIYVDRTVYFDLVFASKANPGSEAFRITVPQSRIDAEVAKRPSSKLLKSVQNMNSRYTVEFNDGTVKSIDGLHRSTIAEQMRKQELHRSGARDETLLAAESPMMTGVDERMLRNAASSPAPLDPEAAAKRPNFRGWQNAN